MKGPLIRLFGSSSFFSALFLDAFAVTGQSLIGYFLGAGAVSHARRVAAVVCRWSVGTGVCMCIAMLLGEQGVVWLLVPPTAYEVFGPAWLVVALTQPIGSLSFATDGIHWGTGDFRYLRNVMFIAVGLSFGLLVWMANVEPGADACRYLECNRFVGIYSCRAWTGASLAGDRGCSACGADVKNPLHLTRRGFAVLGASGQPDS